MKDLETLKAQRVKKIEDQILLLRFSFESLEGTPRIGQMEGETVKSQKKINKRCITGPESQHKSLC